MSDYLTDYNPANSNVKVELDLKNYATKEDISHVDTRSFALKTTLKTEVDKLDTPKLITTPNELAKLTIGVKEDFIKKTDFNSFKTKVDKNKSDNDNLEIIINKNDAVIKAIVNNLKGKVDGFDLKKYVLKSNYDTKIGNLELKILDISGKLNTSDFNSKVNE